MTSMQENAVALIQEMPEEQLSALLFIMRAMGGDFQISDNTKKERAFAELERLRRPIHDLNEKQELESWRKEKFGYAGVD